MVTLLHALAILGTASSRSALGAVLGLLAVLVSRRRRSAKMDVKLVDHVLLEDPELTLTKASDGVPYAPR